MVEQGMNRKEDVQRPKQGAFKFENIDIDEKMI